MFRTTISTRNTGLTLEQIREQAAAQEIPNLERIIADPKTDPRTRYEAEQRLPNARAERGLDPDTGEPTDAFRIKSLSTEDLLSEYGAHKAEREAAELDARQTQAAIDWMASESRYKPTMSNSKKMVAELHRRGLPGTVFDFMEIFEHLASKGDLDLNAHYLKPRRVYSREELASMSAAEMKEALTEMGVSEHFVANPPDGVHRNG